MSKVISLQDKLTERSTELREKASTSPSHTKQILESNKGFIGTYNQFSSNRLNLLKKLALKFHNNNNIFNEAMNELEQLNPTPENIINLVDTFFKENIEDPYNKIMSIATKEELLFLGIK